MKKNKLQQKLFESGLIEKGNTADIRAFKRQHTLEYALNHQKEYSEKTVRKTLIFTKEEMGFLTEKASEYNMKLSPFLKELAFAYLLGYFVNPDKNQKKVIEEELREMKNRITESIQYVHLNKNVSIKDIEALIQKITTLQETLNKHLENPPKLEDWIENQIEKDALFLSKLLKAIAYFL
jgi:hypothetical protein